METEENKLVLNNINLAYKVAWDYFNKLNKFIEYDELVSLSYLGLVKASKNFNTNKNIAFSTYAYEVMKNEILIYFNKTKNINSITQISLSQEIGDNLYLEDKLYSDNNLEEVIEKTFIINKLYEFINELADIEQQIVKCKLKGITNEQLRNMLNLDITSINTIYSKAVNKLRYKFFKYGGDDI